MSALPGMHRLVLVGFMAAGKSTVGRRLAESLGWAFHDLDEVVESVEGRSVAAIFAESGESYFREVESRVTHEFLARDGVVLATGGGWAAAAPGRVEGVPEGTVTVWLRVSAAEAVRRATGEGERPLLDRAESTADAAALLRQRVSRYAAADFDVDTEGRTAEDVSAQIMARLARLPANHSA